MRVKRLLALVFVISLLTCVPPGFALAEIFWERTFGGSGLDIFTTAQQTSDGGFIVAGHFESFGPACYLAKTDTNGDEEWSRLFYGDGYYLNCAAKLTSDGGILIHGFQLGGSGGVFLIKTDADGNEVWRRILEGWAFLGGNQTSDGGFIFTGSTSPWGQGTTLLVKTDSDGIEQWRNAFVGGNWYGENVFQTADGGYLVGGNGLIKTDANGDMMWWNTDVPGTAHIQTADGGYVVGNVGMNLIKTDSLGNVLWSRWLGGDWGGFVSKTSDGGYIVTGGIDRGFLLDFLLIKTDANGNKEWEKTWGGSDFDLSSAVQQTLDGGYIIAGGTWSSGAGSRDGYLAYYNPLIDSTAPSLAPVSDKTILWPPNHKMVDISIVANATDDSGGSVTLTASISSNEPEDGLGDGATAPDWSEPVIDQANGVINFQLRAERSGSGNGRVYTITITAADASGNSSQSDVEIFVPHDKRKK